MPYPYPYFMKTAPIGNPEAGDEPQHGPALAETTIAAVAGRREDPEREGWLGGC